MTSNFTNECLYVSLAAPDSEYLILHISSEYSRTERKGILFIKEIVQSERLETFRKNIKTKKVTKISLSFDEIDYYDSEVDVYQVPCFEISKGLRKARVHYNNHGTIPKDWQVCLSVQLVKTKSITPVTQIINLAVGRFLTESDIKDITRKLRSVLQGKATSANYMVPNRGN